MYPDKFKLSLIFILFTIVVSVSIFCVKGNNKKITPSQSNNWTDTIVGDFFVRLHSPEPGEPPKIWEGPVEIGKEKGEFTCRIDTSLIRRIRTGQQKGTIVIEGFSESELFEVELNVDSCSNPR